MERVRRAASLCAAVVSLIACGGDPHKAPPAETPPEQEPKAPRPDDDPAESQPPEFVVFTSSGWDVPVGMGFDSVTNMPTSPCLGQPVEFRSASEGGVGTDIFDEDGVLAGLGAYSDELFDRVGLDVKAEFRSFAQTVAGDRALQRSTINSFSVTTGVLTPVRSTDAEWLDSCASTEFVESVSLGAGFLYGLRADFSNEDDARAFTEAYGIDDFYAAIGGEDPEDVEDFFVEHPATIRVFVGQVGTRPIDLTDLRSTARCSTRELEGCMELLHDLQDAMGAFGNALGDATPSDYAGWAPTHLNLEEVVE
jgi:hypothetical protein